LIVRILFFTSHFGEVEFNEGVVYSYVIELCPYAILHIYYDDFIENCFGNSIKIEACNGIEALVSTQNV